MGLPVQYQQMRQAGFEFNSKCFIISLLLSGIFLWLKVLIVGLASINFRYPGSNKIKPIQIYLKILHAGPTLCIM